PNVQTRLQLQHLYRPHCRPSQGRSSDAIPTPESQMAIAEAHVGPLVLVQFLRGCHHSVERSRSRCDGKRSARGRIPNLREPRVAPADRATPLALAPHPEPTKLQAHRKLLRGLMDPISFGTVCKLPQERCEHCSRHLARNIEGRSKSSTRHDWDHLEHAA